MTHRRRSPCCIDEAERWLREYYRLPPGSPVEGEAGWFAGYRQAVSDIRHFRERNRHPKVGEGDVR